MAGTAARHGCPFDAKDFARIAGLLHDLGKCKPAFQAYLRGERPSEPHSGEGARFAAENLGPWGRLIAYCIAGHHAGLANGVGHSAHPPATPLDARLEQAERLELPEGITLPEPSLSAPLAGLPNDETANFRLHFFTRMLFSALVDADLLETEAFYDRVEGRVRERGWPGTLDDMAEALDAHLACFGPPAGTVNQLRAEILAHVRAQAAREPGLFRLTVPTGGGKTLTSLAFALDHARRHGLSRVIHVIPYTSIVEQTADEFREALKDDDAVLEHHSSFDWKGEGLDDPQEGERLKLAAQNWDRPVIVTTAVQFFESLYANRPARCRKLHRLARSVIVLDEAQTLPLKLLRPCLAAVKELARGYGASVVFCTATQPALVKGRAGDGFPAPEGLAPDKARELAPDPPRLYAAFRRVRVRDAGRLDDAALAERLRAEDQVLAIVNSTEHARALFARLKGARGARHLSTRMTADHRRAVLADIRRRLKEGAPVRVVSTSLIEAGVDVDFPQVWRALAGIDSIAQAAGRCNREGKRESAETFVFRTTEDFPPPPDIEQFARIAAEVMETHDDLLSPEAVRAYFQRLFWTRGADQLDAAEVGRHRGILTALSESGRLDFPFADIAAAFRMIEGGVPLVITGGEWGLSAEAEKRLVHIPHAGDIARRLQRVQVQIPPHRRQELIAAGAAEIWRESDFGAQFVFLRNERLYHPDTGLSFENPEDLGGMIF